MNWAIAADNTVAVARFLRQKASKRTNEQMTNDGLDDLSEKLK